MAQEDSNLLKDLQEEVDAEQARIPSLSGQALYDSAKKIVENMGTIFCLLDDNDANQA